MNRDNGSISRRIQFHGSPMVYVWYEKYLKECVFVCASEFYPARNSETSFQNLHTTFRKRSAMKAIKVGGKSHLEAMTACQQNYKFIPWWNLNFKNRWFPWFLIYSLLMDFSLLPDSLKLSAPPPPPAFYLPLSLRPLSLSLYLFLLLSLTIRSELVSDKCILTVLI